MKHFFKCSKVFKHIKVKILYAALFCLFTSFAFGQTAKTSIKVGETNYTVEVKKDQNTTTIKLSDGDRFQALKNINYFTAEALKEIVLNEHAKNLKAQGKPEISSTAETKAQTTIQNAFLELISILYNTEDKGQKIALIKLKSTARVCGIVNGSAKKERKKRRATNNTEDDLSTEGLSKEDSTKLRDLQAQIDVIKGETTPLNNILNINSATLVFEDGAIKNIVVQGTLNNETRIFSNKFSIGTTTRRNIQNFKSVNLYDESNLGASSERIKLSDVIEYKRFPELRTNDFSPADVKVELVPDQPKELFKSPSSRLFSLNIFSDFVGFNEENPNGLVQLEFSKRLNLWTKRSDPWPFVKLGVGFGKFTYMTPRFELAKIEENNRSIKLSSFVGTANDTTSFLSPLELYRFSFARISNELNLIDLQGPAVSLHLNGFAGMAVTQLRDTTNLNNEEQIFDENINSLMLGGVLKAVFNPESKWSYELSARTTYLNPLTDVPLFRSVEDDMLRGANEVLNTWEFLITWNTGSDNKLFGRFRFNHEWEYWNNNFSEFQIGYSIFLKSSQGANKKK